MKRLFPKLILLIIIVPSFSGCSVIFYSYIRNYSNSTVELTIQDRQYAIKTRKENLSYSNVLVDINRHTYAKLTDSLSVNYLDSSTLKILVPAHSTLMINPTFRLRVYDTLGYPIILKQAGKSDTLNFRAASGNVSKNDKSWGFKRTGGLFVQNIFYYDYGSE